MNPIVALFRWLASLDGHVHYVSDDANRAVAAAGPGTRPARVHRDSVESYRGKLEIVDLDRKPVRTARYERPGER